MAKRWKYKRLVDLFTKEQLEAIETLAGNTGVIGTDEDGVEEDMEFKDPADFLRFISMVTLGDMENAMLRRAEREAEENERTNLYGLTDEHAGPVGSTVVPFAKRH